MKNTKKIIFHIDMNAFFASCEVIKKPYLKNVPFAIGSRFTKKGVITTANYVARKYGVNSAMNTNDALKICPNLLMYDCDFDLYNKCSKAFMKVFLSYTNKVEKASIDEAYLDVTDIKKDSLVLAKEIQDKVLKDAKLPCSIGIGETLFLAKMASDLKKPLGITKIDEFNIKKVLYPLAIGDVFGLGKKTVPKLLENNIKKISDFMNLDNADKIKSLIGDRRYNDIYKCITGKSNNKVNASKQFGVTSLGNSRTYDHEIVLDSEIKERFLTLAHMVSKKMKKEKKVGKRISITIKYCNYLVKIKSKTLLEYINDPLLIYSKAISIFYDCYEYEPIRLLGITLSNFKKENDKERNLFAIEEFLIKEESLEKAIKKINNKYGENVIKKGLK